MENQSSLPLLDVLKEMVNLCQDIHVLLEQDGNYVTKNKFNEIDSSNQKKSQLLTRLGELTTQLSSSYPAGLAKTSETRSEIQPLIKQLSQEVMACCKYININSSLVFSNLQLLKNIWDKASTLKSNNTVYDVSGNLVSDRT